MNSLNNDTRDAAKAIWDYMQLNQQLQKADVLLVLCSHDTRVAEYAAKLYLHGFAPYVIFSGGSGVLTKDIFDKPESEVFAEIAINAGVPEDNVILESESTNTGENILFTYRLLQEQERNFESFILIQKPYMERRTYATFAKQWPRKSTEIRVSSPRFEFDEYLNGGVGVEKIINVMVGDLQRIREYPKVGFQIEQEISGEVWTAYEFLVKQGFTDHLIKD